MATTSNPTKTPPNGSSGVDRVIQLAMTACSAYGRDDLLARLERTRSTITRHGAHVLVVGEFKQGKSSLVNALVGAAICPVDDDIATAVPTFLREGATARAEVVDLADLATSITAGEMPSSGLDPIPKGT